MRHPLGNTPGATPTGATRDPRPDVLLIDASAPARYALRLQLQALSARVRQAHSVEQALPAVYTQRPDLIITAAVLPGMNALELLELLHATPGDGPPPVLIHHHESHWPLARAAAEHGAFAVAADAELPQRLPELLRAAVARGSAISPAALATPASPARRLDPPEPPNAPVALPREAHQSATGICGRLALLAALAGVLIGVWIARLL